MQMLFEAKKGLIMVCYVFERFYVMKAVKMLQMGIRFSAAEWIKVQDYVFVSRMHMWFLKEKYVWLRGISW